MRELYDEANDESLYEDGAISDDLLDEVDEVDVEDASVLQVLRENLALLEPYRTPLKFMFKGISHEAVPVKEINPDKFIFNDIDTKKLFAAVLSEMSVEM